MSWVLKRSPAQLVNRLVLLVLADHANKDGTGAWPSTDTIAAEARCSVRSAQYALGALEAGGAITQTSWSEKGTKVWKVEMTDAASRATFAPRPRARRLRDDAQPATGAAQHATESLSHVAPEPSLEPSGPVPDPPSARARAKAEGEEKPPVVIAEGTTAKTASRLRRTAERTGRDVIDHTTKGGRR